MSLSEKRTSIIFLALMAAGGSFLAYISGQTATFLYGLAAGALVTGALVLAAIAAGSYRKEPASDSATLRFIKQHPLLIGILGGLLVLPSNYVFLHLVSAQTTVFIIGAGLGFFLVTAAIMIAQWRSRSAGETR